MDESGQNLQTIPSSDQEQVQCVMPCPSPNRRAVQKTPSIKEYMFNIRYNLMHSNLIYIPYLHRPQITLDADSEPVFLLGQEYQPGQQQKFLKHFQSTLWMSYRSEAHNGKSDAGWGCMIRVIQMLIAQVLKRNNLHTPIMNIIQIFKEGKGHLLSLENICQQGRIRERFTGCNEILLAVSSIISKHNCQTQQNVINAKNLNILNFRFNMQMFNQKITVQNFQNFKTEQQFPKFVIVSNKLQDSTFPQIYTSHAKHLMRLPSFCGMVGGVSNQALYIIGFQQDKVIILDPHYVQQNNEQDKVIYFKSHPRGIPFTELCSTFSFCFFFENVQAYKNWGAELCYSYRVYKPYLAIQLEVEDPEDIIEKYRKRSEDFQML